MAERYSLLPRFFEVSLMILIMHWLCMSAQRDMQLSFLAIQWILDSQPPWQRELTCRGDAGKSSGLPSASLSDSNENNNKKTKRWR
jgi:hypothetical protein